MSKIWTSLPVSSGKCSIIRKLTQGIAFMFCAFSLSACGPVSSLIDKFDSNDNQRPATSSAPESQAVQTALKEGEAGIVPLPPPGSSMKPLLPGQSGTQYTEEGLPVLQLSYGMNVEQLFAQDIRDPIERVKRVENAVIDIRKELNAITPSIVRLVAVEKDIQNLVEQLEVLLQNEPQSMSTEPSAQDRNRQVSASPPPSGNRQGLSGAGITPRPSSTPDAGTAQRPRQEEAPAPSGSGVTSVREVRIGEHKDKTRLVLDVSGKASFRYDLDTLENLLVIELPDAGWSASRSWRSQKAPLMASYSVQDMQNGGSRMIIQLKHSASVVHSGTIAPNKDSRNHRVVIDLSAPAVHRR